MVAHRIARIMGDRMALLDRIFGLIVAHEGERLDLTRTDRGNWTGGEVGKGELRGSRFGVSARSYPTVDIAGLTRAAAAAIFDRDYFGPLRCADMPAPIALITADAGWNSGVPRAAAWLQRAVGATPDGVIGPRTLAALDARLARDGVAAMASECLAWRLAHMTSNPVLWGEFGAAGSAPKGWSRRLFALAFQASALEAR